MDGTEQRECRKGEIQGHRNEESGSTVENWWRFEVGFATVSQRAQARGRTSPGSKKDLYKAEEVHGGTSSTIVPRFRRQNTI